MRVSAEWFTDLDPPVAGSRRARPPSHLGRLEVEGTCERPGAELPGRGGRADRRVEAHPNADRLTVCQVDAGRQPAPDRLRGEELQGGRQGSARPRGDQAAGRPEIKEANIRDLESNGMLCSARELGLTDDASGPADPRPKELPGTPWPRRSGSTTWYSR